MDHVFHTIGKEIPHLGQVDIHIIASAQERAGNVAVRLNGYLVHTCSNDSFTVVKQMTWGIFSSGLSAAKPWHDERFNGVPMKIWDIKLDLTKMSGTHQETVEKRAFY